MDKNTIIKIKKDVNISELGGEKVMMDFENGKYYMLKGSANAIWDMLTAPITIGEIIEKLLKRYDVSREVCEKEVFAFFEELEKKGFLV